jgi:hypothetical protein
MEILEQYLKTIKTLLPKEQQDDIIQELSENLRSQMEDREAELGRPLTEAEQEDTIQQHGNPLVVAGRYQQRNRSVAFGRQLIGPVLFPLYIKILCLNLGLTAAVIVAIGFAMGRGLEFKTFLVHALIQFAIVTVVFSAAEKYLQRSKDRWDPKDFGIRTKNTPGSVRWLAAFSKSVTSRDPSKVSRSESVALIIFNVIFALWWIPIVSNLLQKTMVTQGASLRLGPGCSMMYLPILLLAIAGTIVPAVNWFRPKWTWLRAAWRTVSSAIFVAILGFSLKAGNWVVFAGNANGLEQHQRLVERINHGFAICIAVAAIISVLIFLIELWKLLRLRGGQSLLITPISGVELS